MNLIEYTRMHEVEEQHWWYLGLHKLILGLIQRESQRLNRTLDIFDAGCGTGRLCQLLATGGYHISGCDVSEEALRLCLQRDIHSVYQADLNTLELEPDKYDVITSIDVLYHSGVNDDIAVMRRLRSGLKPGGMLILNLVANEFLRSTHDIAVHTRERYTRAVLCQRLRAAGFHIEFASYRVSILFPFIAAYRLLARLTRNQNIDQSDVTSDVSLPHWLVNALLLKIITLENAFLRVASLSFGSSVCVVARKVVK